MLGEILKTLKAHQGTEQTDYNPKESPLDRQFDIIFGKEFGVKFGDNEKQLLLSLNSNPSMTAQDLADLFGITKRAVEKRENHHEGRGIHLFCINLCGKGFQCLGSTFYKAVTSKFHVSAIGDILHIHQLVGLAPL